MSDLPGQDRQRPRPVTSRVISLELSFPHARGLSSTTGQDGLPGAFAPRAGRRSFSRRARRFVERGTHVKMTGDNRPAIST